MQLVAGLSRGSREIRLIMDPPDQRWGRPSSYPTLGRSVRTIREFTIFSSTEFKIVQYGVSISSETC